MRNYVAASLCFLGVWIVIVAYLADRERQDDERKAQEPRETP